MANNKRSGLIYTEKRKLQSSNTILKKLYNRKVFSLRILADTINEEGECELIELNFSDPFPELPAFDPIPLNEFKEFVQSIFINNLHEIAGLDEKINEVINKL